MSLFGNVASFGAWAEAAWSKQQQKAAEKAAEKEETTVNQVEDPAPVETQSEVQVVAAPAPVAEPDAVQVNVSATGNSGTGTARASYAAKDIAGQGDVNAAAAGEAEVREATADAVNFARRAAIATQAREQAASLLDTVTEEKGAFARVDVNKTDGTQAYAERKSYAVQPEDRVSKFA
ncbi:hypothetical protein NBRC116586_30880 [Pseudooceanicola nitratireducens]|uniref:hypothetical protein n=1 Tax=Pseudooceanicola nitratireducens TaxID=517719 RepID=UPI00310679EC